MADIEKTIANLKKRGFEASYFNTGKEAADYIVSELKGQTVGIGGSKTVETLGLFERLASDNSVYWHWKQEAAEARKKAAEADVYICSANAVAETGEIVNIDGMGNRLAATLFGKKRVIFIIGINKITEDYDRAVWRARNIAAPLNARRFNLNTPCTKGELKCHDCSSSQRICRALSVLWEKMTGTEKAEVIIVGEELGY